MLRSFLLILCLVLSCANTHADVQRTPTDALAKAQEYLWSQQQEDGSWHSAQYAVMRSGQALTPFVLHTLLASSHTLSKEQLAKSQLAIDFIAAQLDKDGALGKADPDILEYPVYSTAYAVLAIDRHRELDEDASAEQRLKASNILIRLNRFLISSQFDEKSGFTPEMSAYGGWGFDKAQRPGEPGHMDLAHTRRAMDAAFALGVQFTNNGNDALNRCQRFLAVVQKRPETLAVQPVPEGIERPASIPFDGGFYFSPVVLQANKGRLEMDGNYWQSYATATCDGILALVAAGVPKDDDRVKAAVKWLHEHTNVDYPQGIPTDYPEPWGEALQFYHFAVRAEVYAALDFSHEEKLALAEKVAALQNAGGSFANTKSPLMKEDEPLLATALAVIALSHCTQ